MSTYDPLVLASTAATIASGLLGKIDPLAPVSNASAANNAGAVALNNQKIAARSIAIAKLILDLAGAA